MGDDRPDGPNPRPIGVLNRAHSPSGPRDPVKLMSVLGPDFGTMELSRGQSLGPDVQRSRVSDIAHVLQPTGAAAKQKMRPLRGQRMGGAV